jgi:hypothetical protein
MSENLPTTITTDKIEKIFNGAFYQEVPINENVYSIVYSFFLEKMNGLQDVAQSLTQILVAVCYNNKLQPLDILKEFDKATSESSFKRILINVLNTNRYPSSKLGYSKDTYTNKSVLRNIVA